MRISDWSSDVCSSDLVSGRLVAGKGGRLAALDEGRLRRRGGRRRMIGGADGAGRQREGAGRGKQDRTDHHWASTGGVSPPLLSPRRSAHAFARSRSEEHTSGLQSLMRTSYAVFCLQKTKH